VNRRTFLGAGLCCLVGTRITGEDADWRTFEVTTRVELKPTAGLLRVWLPLALAASPAYQRVIKQIWKGNATVLRAIRDERTGTGALFAEWPKGDARPAVDLTLTVATRDRQTEWLNRTVRGEPAATLQAYLRPSKLMPLDGGVRETAQRITRRETGDLAKARAIYEWVVENTVREPAVRGCGSGDPNALFVALSRVSGIPARDVYGLRVASSRTFTSLGATGDVTTAQHCRAEFHSVQHGWVPVDPSDVRKVVLEEKPGLDLASPDVQYARRQLFGTWEMNWVAFNQARDVELPQAAGPPLPFFMYPHGEIDGARLDSLDSQAFRYQIMAREI
jgi:transglutaminase-like putative cysteine protease